MLSPETRALMTDALRPPDGHRVDLAVATTYSMDLNAVLLAPMAFALHDTEGQDLDQVDPLRLLESVRRHSEHTTVFCQAGGIAVPSAYRAVMTFVEDSVYEVVAPNDGGVFHPKVWVVRYAAADGSYQHRMLCLSRNLTFDRSWDTVLRLDEDASAPTPPGTGPLTEFVAALPSLAVRPLPPQRLQQLDDLVGTLSTARFALPADFDSATFVPSGLPGTTPVDLGSGDRVLAVSPFLDVSTVRRLADIAPQGLLLSRQETLDRVGRPSLGPGLTSYVLQRSAEVELGQDQEASPLACSENDRVPEGLHAKTIVVDQGSRTRVLTGSANATTAGLGGRNVEFGVLLEGLRDRCGIAAIWDGSKESPGLSLIVQAHEPPREPEEAPPEDEMSWAIDLFHAELAQAGIRLQVAAVGDGTYRLRLSPQGKSGPGPTRVWPITLARDVHGRPWDVEVEPTWSPVGVRSITPFLAVETTAGTGGSRCTRTAVLRAELAGDPETRRHDVLRDVLRSKDDVLRYLALLLGDPAYDQWVESWGADGAEGFFGGPQGHVDVVVFEPLVKAAARGDASLRRIESLLHDLSSAADGSEDLIPDGFLPIWQAVKDSRGGAS